MIESRSTCVALTAREFQHRLAESGILEADALASAVLSLAGREELAEGEPYARELVCRKILTRFQATSLLLHPSPRLVLNNYILLDPLGSGGMGEVYRATHRRLKRTVALKMLPAAIMESPGDVARFRREMEAAGKMEHANIVAAYDADEADGIHFLVMQHVSGMDFATLVRKVGPLSVNDALQCSLQAARGLAYAHDRGVVHRDIKPANLILGTDGVVRILDMGLAWIAVPYGTRSERDSGSLGRPMGTRGFAAPEQSRLNAAPDPRSDLYSLGVTLFHLLAGKGAEEGRAMPGKRPPQRGQVLRNLRYDVPERLHAVFRRLTAESPDDRYQSADLLIADLQSCGNTTEVAFERLRRLVFAEMHAASTLDETLPLTGVPLDGCSTVPSASDPTAPLPLLPGPK